MKNTSQEYKDNIYALSRRTKASVIFPFVDPEAKEVAQLNAVPTQSSISKSSQLIDSVEEQAGKVASFEKDYWKLDGSFVLPLSSSQSQYGFRGYALSDANGQFTSDNVLRFYFTEPITVPGYTITFDVLSNNYLTDFDVVAYDNSLGVIRRTEVRDNDNSKVVISNGAEGIKYLDIVFLKTNKPLRSVRILEVDFGIILTFEGKNLYTLKLMSESDYLTESIPYDELTLTAQNDGSYNYVAPESYSKNLQQRQKLFYTHALELPDGSMESVYMGEYLLQKWNVSDKEVQFTARRDTSAIDDSMYSQNSLSVGVTAGAFMENILSDCGVTDYDIPSFMYSSPLVTRYAGAVSNKEAMRQVASMCGCAVYITYTGKVVIHKIDFSNGSVDTIDYSNSLQSPDSKSTPYYNSIQLTVYTWVGTAVSSVIETYDAPWRQPGEKPFTYKLDLKICINDARWAALKPWVLEQKFRVLGLRLRSEVSWRQNPAADVGDYVMLQLDKDGGSQKVFTQKQELIYSGGAMRGSTVCIGAGVT